MSRIEVLRPDRPGPLAAAQPLAPRERPPAGAVLTLIENGKPRARDLLSLLGEELRSRLDLKAVDVFSKPSAARPIDADEAHLLAARSRLVITGLGD